MNNREKRNLLLSLLCGDGSLFYRGKSSKNKLRRVALGLAHGDSQLDYLLWKKSILEKYLDREFKIHTVLTYAKKTEKDKKFKSHRISFSYSKFRSWRKFFYPNSKKNTAKILKFITDPKLFLAIWLMDDGTVNYNKSTEYVDLRIHTDGCDMSEMPSIINFLNTNFNIDAKLYMRKYGDGRNHPMVRINRKDAFTIWEIIKDITTTIPSMKHKFRNLEAQYNKLVLKEPTAHNNS